MKSKILSLLALLLFSGLVFTSCDDDDNPSIPKVQLSAELTEISETATAALQIKLVSSVAASDDITIPFTIEGTAVAGTNYTEFSKKTVTIETGQTEASIFLNVKNNPLVEGDKTVIIKIADGVLYELGQNREITLTIKDNETPKSDAPELSFTTGEIITNAYMQEELTVSLGLSKAVKEEISVPIQISGNATAGTDYELVGLGENNTLTLAANELSKEFKVKVKFTSQVDINDSVVFSLKAPNTTAYKVEEGTKSVVKIIDPQVDFSVWINEANRYKFFQTGVQTTNDAGKTVTEYDSKAIAYWLKRYYFDKTDTNPYPEGEYKTLSSESYFQISESDKNQWKPYTHKLHKTVANNVKVIVPEQERYEYQGGDLLGLTKYFSNEATFAKTKLSSTDDWFRFVAMEKGATGGKVVVPEQTITLYKIKEGFNWKEKTTIADGSNAGQYYYAWHTISKATDGDLSQSDKVVPVQIQVKKSVGTFDTKTKEIKVDVTFVCDDKDLSISDKYLAAKDEAQHSYTIKIRYINRY